MEHPQSLRPENFKSITWQQWYPDTHQNLQKTLKILEQTLRPENLKSVAMATVVAGYSTKPNQL